MKFNAGCDNVGCAWTLTNVDEDTARAGVRKHAAEKKHREAFLQMAAGPQAPLLKCDTCGPLDYVLLDGYAVGELLLEGVMFEIRLLDGKYFAATSPESKAYMSGLNEKLWLKEMANYAAETDIAACPKCRGDVGLNEEA